MQAEKVVLGHFPETLALIRHDILFGPSSQKGHCRLAIETMAHDVGNLLAQGRPMLELERIGFTERMPHGGLPFGRPAIGPEEYVP